jgi:hypothetical protein
MKNLPDVWSVKEVAIFRNMSERRIRKLLEDGRIRGKQVGLRTWVIFDRNFEVNPKGRPRKLKRKVE